jgi:N-acetylneuraminic acid mutarotase
MTNIQSVILNFLFNLTL